MCYQIAGVVVFDDIKDCDVNVTYDLIEGEFPPPNISGLVVRDPNDLLTSDDLPAKTGCSSNYSDPDFDERRSEASSSGSKIIGDITIAEYEGSPRRYRPRVSPPQSCEPVPKNGQKRPKLPGFPQRVLPASTLPPVENNEARQRSNRESPVVSEELLKFEDTEHNNHGGGIMSHSGPGNNHHHEMKSEHHHSASDYESKMRYEFSETRKVLDEFFHKEAEIAEEAALAVEAENLDKAIIAEDHTINETQEDLNYVLRKNNNYVVGQRLAIDESLNDKDLLLTTPISNACEPPHTLKIPNSKGPVLGVSPLDQPLLNFGCSMKEQVEHLEEKVNGDGGGSETKPSNPHHPTLASIRGGGSSDVACLPTTVPVPADSRNFTLSPETTDCDSADLESEMSVNEGSFHSSGPKMHTAMPVLEDGLSSGHASDLEDDVIYSR